MQPVPLPFAFGFRAITPVRLNTGYPGLLGDIESHMPAQHGYRDSDVATHAHETQHGLSSRLRNTFKVANAFYVFQNFAMLTTPSNVKLSALAERIPSNMRGKHYKLYLVDQQRYWNNDAAYILEECNCYLSGACVAREYKKLPRTQESFDSACEMSYYASHLYSLTDNSNLQHFIKFTQHRIRSSHSTGVSEGWGSTRAAAWIAATDIILFPK